jgi:hypothetical protein
MHIKFDGFQTSTYLLQLADLQASVLETPLSTSATALLILLISESFGLCFVPFLRDSLFFLGIDAGACHTRSCDTNATYAALKR